MPCTKNRRSFRETLHRCNSKGPRGSKTPSRRRSRLRPSLPGITKKQNAKRRPLSPYNIYTDRLVPFRPAPSLAEAAEKRTAIDKLSALKHSGKVAEQSHFYLACLQSEVLDAPLKVEVEHGRTVLDVIKRPFYSKFSKFVDHRDPNQDSFPLHPLDQCPISKALGMRAELLQTERCVAKVPFRILDAPDLKDDFYYNLIDWSSKDVLSVGLNRAVFLWSAATSKVVELNSHAQNRDEVSSVCWSQGASALAIGGRQGSLQLWDPERKEEIIDYNSQGSRIGSLSWNINTLASGSRSGYVQYLDYRVQNPIYTVKGHTSEICGLKWSHDNVHLASGGNDNIVNIWDVRKPETALWQIREHAAAVKAIAWSPHNTGVFATGGGLRDLNIKVWNLTKRERTMSVNSAAQVCGLHWSDTVNEIVSVHGYNTNSIMVWEASKMECIGSVPGHTSRVVYLTAAPDGQTIATGSGDESIRFYKIFPPAKCTSDVENSRERMNLMVR